MTTVTATFEQIVRERHSVRYYDPKHRMSRTEVEQLLELASLAPSSWNLQHWKFLVLEEAAQKEKLLPIANGQKQVVDASIVIAVLGDLEADKNAEPVYGRAVALGYATEEIKNAMVAQITGAYAAMPHIARDEAIRNASLAAMQLMLAAKSMGYDTCPMGGFDPARLVEEFGIPPRYLPVMLISVGKSARPARASGRFSLNEIAVWNSF